MRRITRATSAGSARRPGGRARRSRGSRSAGSAARGSRRPRTGASAPRRRAPPPRRPPGARKADSICTSIPFRARDSRPTSVRGSLSGTRRVRSPAAMAAAVCSTSTSGRRSGVRRRTPAPPSSTSTTSPTIAARARRAGATVVSTSPTARPPTQHRTGRQATGQLQRPRASRASPFAADRERLRACCQDSAWSRTGGAAEASVSSVIGERVPALVQVTRSRSGRPGTERRGTSPAAAAARRTRELDGRDLSGQITVDLGDEVAASCVGGREAGDDQATADEHQQRDDEHVTRNGARAGVPARSSSADGGDQCTRQPHHVAHAAQRVQQPRLAGVDLAAQIGDVGLDDVGVAAEVVVPHVVEDLRLGQHAPGFCMR